MQTSRQIATFCPFLYNTATIRRICSNTNTSLKSFSNFDHGYFCAPKRQQSRSSPTAIQTAAFSASAKSSRNSEYIPFEGQEDRRNASINSSLEPIARSTLTDEEEKAFTHLLDKAQEASKKKDDIQKLRQASSKAIQSKQEDSSSHDSVISILQGALTTSAKEKDKTDLSETLPPPLRTLLQAKRPPPQPHEEFPPKHPHEDERIVNRAQDLEFSRVDQLLSAAQTDVDLWQVLETHVFARVSGLNHDLSSGLNHDLSSGLSSSSSSSSSSSTASSGSSSSSSSSSSDGAPLHQLTKRTQAQLKSTSAHAERLQPSQLTRKQASKDVQKRRDAALAVLGPNYSAWLVRATRLLRHDFPGSSLALSVLPKVKALGVASYAMGASTMLYHELIGMHWMGYGDLDGVDALLREMEVAGLDFDADTLELLDGICGQNARARRGKEGLVMWQVVRMDGNVRRARNMEAWRVRVRQRLETDALNAAEKVAERAEAERERSEEALMAKEGEEREEEVQRLLGSVA